MKKMKRVWILLIVISILFSGCTSQSSNQQSVPHSPSIQQIIPSVPDWTNTGNEFTNQGRNQEAVEAFDTALSLDPNYSPAWNGKGNALFNLGKTQEALDAFNKALSINPNFSSAWHGKGNALSSLEKPQEALDAYNQALSLDINNQWAWFGKGNVFFSLGRYQEALEAYDRAISINVNNSPAWASKGHTLLKLGRTQEALQAFDRALSIDPNNQWANVGKNSALSGSPIPPIPPQPTSQIPSQPTPTLSQPIQRFPISDGHAHLFNMDDPVQNADNLVKKMDNAGVSSAVLFGGCDQPYFNKDVYVNGVRVEADQRVLEAYKKYPTRFYPMLSGFNPQDPNAPQYLDQQLSTGMWRGIGEIYMVHESLPTYKTLANHPVMLQIYRVLSRHNVPIFFHYERWAQEDIDTLYNVIGQNPDVTFVWVHLAHTGNLREIDNALGRYPNLDISWEGTTSRDMGASLEFLALLEKYPHRFILGSDVGCMENFLTPTLHQPFGDVIELHQQVLSQLSPQTSERIAHQNLEELMWGSAKSTPLQQVKSGTLQHDETWSGEIYIPDAVRVPHGVTLTIEPGTVIKFKYSRSYRDLLRGMLVIAGGTVKAIGTPTNPIWFTSSAEKPINGDWLGIVVENSNGENTFSNCIVEYAFIGIRFWTASGTVTNSIVRWINAEGIYMERSHVVIENSMFYGTGYNGIAMEQFNDVTIRNNKIFNNQGAGIHGEATKAMVENNIVRDSKLGITFEDLSEVTLRNNLVENCRSEGIHLYFNSIGSFISNKVRNNGIGITSSNSRLTISNSDIYGNARNLVLYTMQQVDVRHNWWGSTENAAITGNIESDVDVAIEPYLNEETVSIPDPVYDYQDVKKTELGYIPGDPQDQYPYIFAGTDETRRVVKKTCGAAEGFGEFAIGWSLAWDGRYLWRSKHGGSGELIKIDPETCAIVADFGNVGVAQDRGMAFDGKSLWINDFTQKRVFEIDPSTGKVISSFNIPDMGSGSSGIAWDGEFLYLVDWLTCNQVGAQLYKVDRQGHLIGILQLEKEGGATITFDGQYFWISPCRMGICKYDKEGKLSGEIYAAAFGGEAIAHDGSYLWVLYRTQELWGDPKLYKIEVLNDQILL